MTEKFNSTAELFRTIVAPGTKGEREPAELCSHGHLSTQQYIPRKAEDRASAASRIGHQHPTETTWPPRRINKGWWGPRPVVELRGTRCFRRVRSRIPRLCRRRILLLLLLLRVGQSLLTRASERHWGGIS